ISASVSSVAGLIESKYLPDFGATNLPPMNRSYFRFSFGSAVSGAGSYSHRSPKIRCGTELEPVARVTGLVDVISVALGGLSEVVRRLVSAGLFFFDLSQQVVQERAGAEAIARRVEPCVAQGFLDGDEVMERLLRGLDAACGLHSDGDARREVEIANGLDHHLCVRQSRASGGFARARLDEVSGANHLHGQK